MLKEQGVEIFGLPRYLGDGLTLRWGVAADVEQLFEFNSHIHSDTDEPDEGVGYWTRDLMNGEHPTTGPADFTVVVDENKGGKIVSTLNLISQTWAYDDIPFGFGRPEAVGTNPEYRRKGLVRLQFEAIHAKSAARGELMQGITGIPWYYRQFGYEMALNLAGARRLFWNNVTQLEKDQTESYRLRPATVADIPVLSHLYAIHCSYSLLSRIRNQTEWEYELTSTHEKSIVHHRFFIIEDLTGSPVGYVETGFYPNTIAVRELAVLPIHSLRIVAEFLTRVLKTMSDERSKAENKEVAYSWVSFTLGAAHPVYTALGNQLERQVVPYAWYIRIADLPIFLRHIAPALDKRLEGSVMAGYSGTLRLNFYRQHLALIFERGKLVEVGTYQPKTLQDGDALFPDLTFLQLLMGFRSLDELKYAYPDCLTNNERASVLLNTLFPQRASAVSALG